MSYDITSRFFHWMEANNITRSEAAKSLGVDERSLSTYRSRGLPKKKGARAEQIMRDHTSSTLLSPTENTRIPVVFTDEEFAIVERAAQITHCCTPEFIHKAACSEAKKRIAQSETLKVAQDPTEYVAKEGNG